jgi:hypothetical protein
MKFHKLQWLVVYTMLSIILSSCNLGATPVPTQDIGAIQTQAFNLVLTQAALASTATPMPTNTMAPTATLAAPATFIVVGGASPIPFNTALPGLGLTPLALSTPVPTTGGMIPTKNGCNDAQLVGESTPYDGQVIQASYKFQKNFDFVNTGDCKWDEGYTFVFLPSYSTPGFVGYDIAFRKVVDFVKPQGRITFTLKLTASNKAGEHIGAWKLRDDGGNFFGSMVHIKYVILTRAQVQATAGD